MDPLSPFETLEPTDRELLEVARGAAREAAEVHRARSSGAREWNEKGRADFVTDVDLEAQDVILEAIGSAFPSHRVVAEEETRRAAAAAGDRVAGSSPSSRNAASAGEEAAFRWIVDPLDGTTNWLHGYPAYAASLAVEDDEGLRAAVVLNSATGELFEAVRGAGARRDGEEVAVSDLTDLRLALVGTGFPFKKPEYLDDYLTVFGRLLLATSGIRRAGSAALDLCDLACGRLDAFWELWLMPWDVAAGALVLQEAGGRLERIPLPDDEGEPVSSPRSFAARDGGAYVASNGPLHGELLATVRGEATA